MVEGRREQEGRGRHTSEAIVRSSGHINRGRMFFKKARLRSVSMISSSASRGWRGKDAGEDLQAFMAQVRKLRVRSFILAVVDLRFRIWLWCDGIFGMGKYF
jgi:hypothetical protein